MASAKDPFSFSSPERNGGAAPVVVWNVTNSCNMSCPHCYSSAVKGRSEYGLCLADLKSIGIRLEEAGVRVVILSGGEPLLRNDVEELAVFLKGRRISCHLSTNGVLLTPERARSLRDAGIVYAGSASTACPISTIAIADCAMPLSGHWPASKTPVRSACAPACG